MFPSAELIGSGEVILITDQLEAPADFMVHRMITSYLKESKETRCIILSLSNDLPRWKMVSSKSNLNIDQQIESGSFKFVDLVPYLGTSQSPVSPLVDLFTSVKDYVMMNSSTKARTVVVFDDSSSLEWLGHPNTDSTRFIRALCSLCRKHNAPILIRHHVINQEEPDDILRQLLQLAAYRIEVLPLSSGKSGAVSGELTLHAGPTLVDSSIRFISRVQALQYRLTDYGVVFFDKGTGGGIL